MKSRLFFFSSLLGSLLLSACGQVQIGARIRHGSELHVGVAREHATAHFYPRENLKAKNQGAQVSPDVVLAPEVTYRIRRPLINVYLADKRPPVDITPTGRLVYATRGKLVDAGAVEGLVRVPQSPEPDKPFDYTDAAQLGDMDSPLATEASLGSRIAAAPFDYVLDPALTAVSLAPGVAVAGAAIVVATPIWFTWWLFDRDALPPWAPFCH